MLPRGGGKLGAGTILPTVGTDVGRIREKTMQTFSKVLLGAGAVALVAVGIARADGWGWYGWHRGGPGWGGPMMGWNGGPQGGPMGGPMMQGNGPMPGPMMGMMGGPGGMRGMLVERLDVNKDGAVTLDEMTKQRDDAFAAADANHDGVVDKTEMDAFILKMMEPMRDRMFARMDLNGDGKITKDEVDSPLKKRFALFDRNDDGKITKEELAASGPGMMGPSMGRGWHGHHGFGGGWFGGPGSL
jgi:hypothetical protein